MNEKYIHLLFLLITVSTLHSCSKPMDTEISFYYWRTIFKLSNNEKSVINENSTKKLYIRYFDIDITENGQVFPVAKLNINDTTTCEIIPVIYIKNKVMLSKQWDINELVNNILTLIKQIHSQTNSSLEEIQIDCDWSAMSKERFMTFVNTFKQEWNGKLSATIRLHQIKYFSQTGIPNVDYGVLMYYNMGKIDDTSRNSIYDKDIAQQYTKSLSNYPLPLKIALPIFSWGIQTRNGKVIGIFGKKTLSDLKNNNNLIDLNNNSFKVIIPFYEQGKYFETDDIIICESVSTNDLEEMTLHLLQQNKIFENEIIFYDLDSINIQQYDKEIFKKVSAKF